MSAVSLAQTAEGSRASGSIGRKQQGFFYSEGGSFSSGFEAGLQRRCRGSASGFPVGSAVRVLLGYENVWLTGVVCELGLTGSWISVSRSANGLPCDYRRIFVLHREMVGVVA
jgi:hypothetical protein